MRIDTKFHDYYTTHVWKFLKKNVFKDTLDYLQKCQDCGLIVEEKGSLKSSQKSMKFMKDGKQIPDMVKCKKKNL